MININEIYGGIDPKQYVAKGWRLGDYAAEIVLFLSGLEERFPQCLQQFRDRTMEENKKWCLSMALGFSRPVVTRQAEEDIWKWCLAAYPILKGKEK